MVKDTIPYRILVLEDNPGDFILIQDFLEETIAEPLITRAANFEEGKHLLTTEKASFQVILLDLTLPDKSGENLISEIMPISAGIPIIVLTGYGDISFSVKSLSLGAADYLIKDDLSASSLYKSILYNIERKKKSLELEESERRYSDLFHLSPQPMWVYETASLGFMDVNNAAIKHYGYSREEFLRMTIKDIRSEEDMTKMEEAIHGSLLHLHLFFQGVHQLKKKCGKVIQVELQSNAILFKGKSAELVLANDITERLSYIDAIERQNENLREIAWLQSHIVRAPLTRMMSIVDMIKNHESPEIDKNVLLDHFLISAYELDSIIRDIMRKTDHIELNEVK